MAKKAMQNQGLCVMDLTPHELDVILAYRSKLETHRGVDILLGVEEERGVKQVSDSVISLGFDVNLIEDRYDEFCKMQRRIEKWNPEIGEYVQKHVNKLGDRVIGLRNGYNRLYEE